MDEKAEIIFMQTRLCRNEPKTKSCPEKKLKCQYVAMTRERVLLCLAIPIDFADESAQKQLRWNIECV